MSLKVVAVVDKVNTALDRLAKGVAPYHDNIQYVVCDVHPKKPDQDQLSRFVAEVADADVIDFQYFRSALMLIEKFGLKDKKKVLTHNNPYSLYDNDWSDFDMVVGNNLTIQKNLKDFTHREIPHIPITVNAYFWEYKRQFEPNKNVIMVANRIESKKGILPVAIACGDAGLKLILVGAISDRNYFHDIMQTGAVEYHEQITDKKLLELYHQSTIHVCNSKDNFESGTMPVLEAMLCGVPVLSRPVGHVPDLYNDENIIIYEGDYEDNVAIQQELERMLIDTKKLEVQRASAWNTAKNHNFERRAYEYQKLYRKVLSDAPAVSVVVPIHENPEVIRKCLNAIALQEYPNIELVVVNDGSNIENYEIIEVFSKTVSFPVRYINNEIVVGGDGLDDYGLARARNKGIIEATGEIIVFCDQRQIMEPDAITKFVDNLVPKTWVFGNKGGNKKDFIENFSAVYRDDIIRAGMFCERIDAYGGMSQEVRARTRMQGIRHVYIEDAKATPMGKSSNKNAKKQDIIRIKNRLYKMGL